MAPPGHNIKYICSIKFIVFIHHDSEFVSAKTFRVKILNGFLLPMVLLLNGNLCIFERLTWIAIDWAYCVNSCAFFYRFFFVVALLSTTKKKDSLFYEVMQIGWCWCIHNPRQYNTIKYNKNGTNLQLPSRPKRVLCQMKAHQRKLHTGISLFVSAKLFSIEHVLHSILPAMLSRA